MRVDIETHSPLSAGQTVCDVWHQSKLPANCNVCMSVDAESVWELILETLTVADGLSPMNKGPLVLATAN